MGSALLPIFDSSNPLTTSALIKTILFQVGFLGSGTLIAFLWLVPKLAKYQGVHPIMEDERMAISANPILRLIYRKAKRWYDHIWYSLISTTAKTVALFFLGLTLFILLTDVGWLDAWKLYIDSPTDYVRFFVMARASGAPNGAHLLSYIPLPILGAYVAWKYRATSPGNSYLGDVYQGILIVAFGVAVHEGIWIIFYYFQYAQFLNLALLPNILEDIFFSVMCVMFLIAFWKYPLRTIPMKIFELPIMVYFVFCCFWYLDGMKVSTLNNYQIGHSIYMITQYWADPTVNAIEIVSWILIAGAFFLAIKYGSNKIVNC